MRRPFAYVVFAAVAAVGVPVVTAAAAPATPPNGGPPGSVVAHASTECADHGGFRALGRFGSGPLHDIGVNDQGSNHRPGATSWMFPSDSGSTTGGNNNALCGGGNVPSPFDGA
jgi:hypothetical protein